MDHKLKQRWLDALRSGNYEQARGQLRVDTDVLVGSEKQIQESYCCLGVLVEISGDFEGEDCWLQDACVPIYDPETLTWSDEQDHAEGDDLPEWLLDRYGLTRDETDDLIDMNDGIRWQNKIGGKLEQSPEQVDGKVYESGKTPKSFAEIADYIEEHIQ